MGDFINGMFEMGGAVLLALHVRKLWQDKMVRGVSPWPFVFFTLWGWWNLYFYPSVDCWWSFAGGIPVVAVNSIYLYLMWKFRNN